MAEDERVDTPINMLLSCPVCGVQHIDEPDALTGWENPPHRSHLCDECGCIWRPADVATNGVSSIETVGKSDTYTRDRHLLEAGFRPVIPHIQAQLDRAVELLEEIADIGDDVPCTDCQASGRASRAFLASIKDETR